MIDKRALAYYNLSRMPFGKDLPPDQLFVSAALKELRSRLDYMKGQRGLMLLTGSPGVGKTAALRSFAASLNPGSYTVLYTPLSTVTVTDFYRQLNFALGGRPHWRKNDVFTSIQSQIRDLVSQQKKIPVIILDEAHLLSAANLTEVQIITNFQMDSLDPALFILAGQSHLREKLASPVFDSLLQRLHMKYHLPPLAQEEFGPFVAHHLKTAGCTSALFSPDAVDALYQNTAGIHRKVALLAHRTLTVGAIQKKDTLTSEEVFLAFKSCSREEAMEQEISVLLSRLKSIDGYPYDPLKDAPLLEAVQREFPEVDFAEELARLSIWLSDLAPGSRRIHQRLLLRKWIYNAAKGNAPPVTPPRRTLYFADRRSVVGLAFALRMVRPVTFCPLQLSKPTCCQYLIQTHWTTRCGTEYALPEIIRA